MLGRGQRGASWVRRGETYLVEEGPVADDDEAELLEAEAEDAETAVEAEEMTEEMAEEISDEAL